MPRHGLTRSLAPSLALSLALSLAPWPARADERVLYLREVGAVGSPPSGAVIPPAVSPSADPGEARARAALDQAREQFLASSFADAAATLRREASRAAPELVRGHRALAVELELWTGACEFLAGDRETSRAAFGRALSLAPDASLPSAAFPPEVEEFFTAVARERLSRPPSVVTVRTAPSGARVEVDGAPSGTTPATLTLSPGVHYLRLERLGYQRWTGVLQAEGPDPHTREVVLQPALGTELRAQVGRPEGLSEVPDGPTLARLRSEFRVERVLFLRRDGSELRHPGTSAPVWPWITLGAVAATGVGVLVYLLATQEPTYTLRSPGY